MNDKLNFKRNQFVVFISILLFVLLVGVISSEYLVRFGEARERRSLLQLTETATAAIDATQVSQLEGIPEEADSTQYKILKKQVELLHTHVPEAGFIYLMRLKGGRGVFIADSEPADSKDSVLPGETWDEPTKEFIQAFITGKSFTEGPIEDKWGVWVSGLAAIRHTETQAVHALLGIDISATHWNKTILSYRLLGYALTVSLLILVVFFYIYTNKLQRANQAILIEMSERRKAEHEIKELGGLLPICASCKKIRDDKGYWNNLETYIEKHSDASFSHGMCKECSDAMYGNNDWYLNMQKDKDSNKQN
ncbi:MAG: hypothetical protein MI802_14885 [Desulfobacterales bacterium]|nr:hypothetical protein [Desulfobacterales bacterium]